MTHKNTTGNDYIKEILEQLSYLNTAISHAPNDALEKGKITTELDHLKYRLEYITELAQERLYEPFGDKLVPTWSEDILGRDIPTAYTLSRQLLDLEQERYEQKRAIELLALPIES